MNERFLEVDDLFKSYGEGGSYTQVLKGVSFQASRGELCVIQGSSGSGKSTLLNCIGGLDRTDGGRIAVEGREITALNSGALSEYRRADLGFIFQFYNLVPNLPLVLLPGDVRADPDDVSPDQPAADAKHPENHPGGGTEKQRITSLQRKNRTAFMPPGFFNNSLFWTVC